MDFKTEVQNRGLKQIWLKGLGLEDPQARLARIYLYKEHEYSALRALGWGHTRAIEETLALGPRYRKSLSGASEGVLAPLDDMSITDQKET